MVYLLFIAVLTNYSKTQWLKKQWFIRTVNWLGSAEQFFFTCCLLGSFLWLESSTGTRRPKMASHMSLVAHLEWLQLAQSPSVWSYHSVVWLGFLILCLDPKTVGEKKLQNLLKSSSRSHTAFLLLHFIGLSKRQDKPRFKGRRNRFAYLRGG